MAYRIAADLLGQPVILKAENGTATLDEQREMSLAFSSLLALEWIDSLEDIILARFTKDEAEALLETAVESARDAVRNSLAGKAQHLFDVWLEAQGIPTVSRG